MLLFHFSRRPDAFHTPRLLLQGQRINTYSYLCTGFLAPVDPWPSPLNPVERGLSEVPPLNPKPEALNRKQKPPPLINPKGDTFRRSRRVKTRIREPQVRNWLRALRFRVQGWGFRV